MGSYTEDSLCPVIFCITLEVPKQILLINKITNLYTVRCNNVQLFLKWNVELKSIPPPPPPLHLQVGWQEIKKTMLYFRSHCLLYKYNVLKIQFQEFRVVNFLNLAADGRWASRCLLEFTRPAAVSMSSDVRVPVQYRYLHRIFTSAGKVFLFFNQQADPIHIWF